MFYHVNTMQCLAMLVVSSDQILSCIQSVVCVYSREKYHEAHEVEVGGGGGGGLVGDREKVGTGCVQLGTGMEVDGEWSATSLKVLSDMHSS